MRIKHSKRIILLLFIYIIFLSLVMNFPDVADVVTFLVSDRSSYITGQSFEVNSMVPITPRGGGGYFQKN